MASDAQATGVHPSDGWPEDRLEAAKEIVRRVLVRAEEEYLADPDLTLGIWLTRVQETISVASSMTLAGSEAGRSLDDDDVAADAIGVFADLCAEAIRAAARLVPGASRDPKEAVLAVACRDDCLIPLGTGWGDLKDSLIRCQVAVEPLASTLRDADRPVSNVAGDEAYSAFVDVIRHAFPVVHGLCGRSPQLRATTVGVAGRTVREASRRTYGKATWVGVKSALVLIAAVAVAANGAPAVAAVMALASVALGRKVWSLRRAAVDYRLGASGEEVVGAILGGLPAPWIVEHDVVKPGGGNVDHVVHSPWAIFAIDTKLNRFRKKDLAQAHRHADWVAVQAGTGKPIVPLICEQRSDRPAELMGGGVWVMGASHLLGFLLDRTATESPARQIPLEHQPPPSL